MTTIQRTEPRKYLAWCSACEDGYQGSKAHAQRWAAAHDANRHPVEP